MVYSHMFIKKDKLMAHLIISQIGCVTPSYGVADWANGAMTLITTAFGAGLGTAIGASAGASIGASAGALASSVTGPAAVIVAPLASITAGLVTSASGAAVGGSIGTAVGAGIGAAAAEATKTIGQHINDDVALMIGNPDDKDVLWPEQGRGLITDNVNMKSDDIEDVHIRVNIPDNQHVTLSLMEIDNTFNDVLGSGSFHANSESGVYSFQNDQEGSIYYLTVEVFK